MHHARPRLITAGGDVNVRKDTKTPATARQLSKGERHANDPANLWDDAAKLGKIFHSHRAIGTALSTWLVMKLLHGCQCGCSSRKTVRLMLGGELPARNICHLEL